MKIRTKSFLIFQIAVAYVAAIIMMLYWMLISGESISGCLIDTIVSIIYFAIALFPAWKYWRGNTWYSLSLQFLLAITVVFLIMFAAAFIWDNWDKGTSLGILWLCIIYYIIAASANIIAACLIGLLGKYITKAFHNA